MKYVIKSQVKPYTRTRKGKMERVGGYSREKSRERLTHLPLSTLQNLLGDKDPDTKEFQADVRAEIAKQMRVEEEETARKKMARAKTEEGVKKVLREWGTALYRKKTKVGEPYSVTMKDIHSDWDFYQKYNPKFKRETAGKELVGGYEFRNLENQRCISFSYRTKGEIDLETININQATGEVSREKLGEPYSVKEHTQDEYKKYLASLDQDEKELSLEQWKLRLALEPIGEPYEAKKPLRHIEIEPKSGMRRTEEWKIKEALKENNNTEKPPKYLNAKWKKDINKELHDISTKYHTEFPSDEIFDSLKKRGVIVLQEDGTEFEGFFLGNNAQTTFQLAPAGSIRRLSVKDGDATLYTPFKNTALVMGWYKMPSGKYEMTTYVG